MKVKLIFDAHFIGCVEQIIELQSTASDEDIQAMFQVKFGLPYDDNCSYEIIK